MADKVDFTEQYAALWKSPLGEDILNTLIKIHDSLIEDGEKADTMEKGYGLLNQGGGVMFAISQLKAKGVVPKARRNGEVNNK